MCAKCGSVERHRIIFNMYKQMPQITNNADVLQFAPDCSIQKSSFKSYTGSVYGGENSMDIKDTKLESGSFDFVISNHVFEHIDDDIAALKECLRLVGDSGVVHICVPTPAYTAQTVDWGYPDKTKAYHYRNYGADFGVHFCKQVGELNGLIVVGEDTISETSDLILLLSKNVGTLQKISVLLEKTEFMCIPLFTC